MKLLSVVGARPQFVKLAPLVHSLRKSAKRIKHILVHSGQHYDYSLSKIFFDQLIIPDVDYDLNIGSSSHAVQIADMLKGIETILIKEKPDWVIVYGDTNTTLAGALAAAKLNIPIAHVEAGLRSFDRSMPEEVNRVIVDQLAELLFIHSPEARINLLKEGVLASKIHFVGNIMIDSLIKLLPKTQSRWGVLKKRFDFNKFILITIHRPSNVDDWNNLSQILDALNILAKRIPVIFPVHPRTYKIIKSNGFDLAMEKNLQLIAPLGYLDFIVLEKQAALVLTDSGGVQEETTFLHVPCLTIRPNTERPITITLGTNKLVKNSSKDIVAAALKILGANRNNKKSKVPRFWDGHTAKRIVEIMKRISKT